MPADASRPWISLLDASAEQTTGLLQELRRELSKEHPVYGRIESLVARCGVCDDVVVRLTHDAGFAVVHLTWSGRAETPPYPRTTMLPTFIALEMVMDQHEH